MNPLSLLGPYSWIAYLVVAIGLVAGGAYGMHHWDQVAYLKLQNNYNTVKGNQATLQTGLDTCNAGVNAQADAIAKALADKQAQVDKAKSGQQAAEATAKGLLARKPAPSMDVCHAAFGLIKEQIR